MSGTIDGIKGQNFLMPASAGATTTSPEGMTIDDFYKLLSAQLKYQDADNPMNTSEMMAQMVQTQMIEAITQMSTVNTITYASSMVGKTVTMAEIDENGMFSGETTSGVVTGMLMGDNPILYIGDKGYFMAQIMTIGEVPEKVPEEESGGDTGGDSENTGGDNGDTKTD